MNTSFSFLSARKYSLASKPCFKPDLYFVTKKILKMNQAENEWLI